MIVQIQYTFPDFIRLLKITDFPGVSCEALSSVFTFWPKFLVPDLNSRDMLHEDIDSEFFQNFYSLCMAIFFNRSLV